MSSQASQNAGTTSRKKRCKPLGVFGMIEHDEEDEEMAYSSQQSSRLEQGSKSS